MTKRIIVVEDSMTFCERICNMLKRQGWETSKAYNMHKGMELVQEADEFTIVLSDLRLPDGDGIKLLEWMRGNGYENKFVIMTDYESYSSAVAAIKKGAANYFPKSQMQGDLFPFLDALWKGNEHIAKSREKNFSRTSEAFTKVTEMVNMFAPIQITVMILGESGTGKEHIARMIHEKSKRANKPFVTLDCGTLNEQLAASTLFGHEKGAFTGADAVRIGVFEEAKGGTLFLDEIGNLSMEVQKMLLRVVQEHKFRRVGGTKDIEADVRLVLATNEDLGKAVNNDTFKYDLLQRLCETIIELPPLREAVEDVKPLAEFFLRRYKLRFGKDIDGFSTGAIKALETYTWPGNVRELKRVVKNAVVMAKDKTITEDVLKFDNFSHSSSVSTALRDTDSERERIIAALKLAKGNRTRAAEILDIGRTTLYKLKDKYGIT